MTDTADALVRQVREEAKRAVAETYAPTAQTQIAVYERHLRALAEGLEDARRTIRLLRGEGEAK